MKEKEAEDLINELAANGEELDVDKDLSDCNLEDIVSIYDSVNENELLQLKKVNNNAWEIQII